MKKILILSKSFTSGNAVDLNVLENILSRHFKCIRLEGDKNSDIKKLKHVRIFAKIILEHIVHGWLQIPSEKTYFIPNHEMLTEWDILLAQKVDMVLCKNQYTFDYMAKFNRTLIKFTSPCGPFITNRDFNIVIHFGGTSFMKGTLELLKYWVRCGGFLDLAPNIKLLFTHTPKFNNDVINYWSSLKPRNVHQCCGRKIECSTYKNIFYLGTLSNRDFKYFSDLAGIRVQPSILEGFGHAINESRCSGALTVTTDASPMNELITNKSCLIKPNRSIPSYDVFKPFKKRYEYMYRGSSRAWYIDYGDFYEKMKNIIEMTEEEKNKIIDEQYKDFVKDREFFKKTILKLFNVNSTVIDLFEWEKSRYSQNGEDGIIEKIFNTIGTSDSPYYVEFGVEDGTECNTRYLREKNWTGLMMDGGNYNKEINLQKEFIYQSNIIQLFKKYKVPKEFEFLSTDIDYNDFYVLMTILKSYRPKVICAEYNSYLGPLTDSVVVYDPEMMWDKTTYFGASINAFNNLFAHFNYALVGGTSNGVNIFAIRNDVIGPARFKNMGNPQKIHRFLNGYHKDDYFKRGYVTSKAILHFKPPLIQYMIRTSEEIAKTADTSYISAYKRLKNKKLWSEAKKLEDRMYDDIISKISYTDIARVLVLNYISRIK
jgi:hypothetical protein